MKSLVFFILCVIVLQAGDTQTCTDKETGLMWQNNDAIGNVKKTWMDMTNVNATKCLYGGVQESCSDTSGDTATTYCENLQLDGFDDWRLPSRIELSSFGLHIGQSPNELIKFIRKGEFWSATSAQYENKPREAAYAIKYWKDKEFPGSTLTRDKHNSLYVRCVRGSLREDHPIWQLKEQYK
jgi:hypothetical protein